MAGDPIARAHSWMGLLCFIFPASSLWPAQLTRRDALDLPAWILRHAWRPTRAVLEGRPGEGSGEPLGLPSAVSIPSFHVLLAVPHPRPPAIRGSTSAPVVILNTSLRIVNPDGGTVAGVCLETQLSVLVSHLVYLLLSFSRFPFIPWVGLVSRMTPILCVFPNCWCRAESTAGSQHTCRLIMSPEEERGLCWAESRSLSFSSGSATWAAVG